MSSHSTAYETALRNLKCLNWKHLLRHVVCPAWVHFKEEPPQDFGALFFHPATTEEQKKRITDFRKTCQIPPLICSDMESGPGMMIRGATDFPSLFGCGVAGSEELAYDMGRCAAQESSTLGFNWTLAPVCDLALEIDSPVVAQRAAGRTPEAVIPIVTGYIRGLQDHGMAATAKHFPGDGFATIDQHLSTPVNRMSREEWDATYRRTFSAAIQSGVACIMPGHIGLSWIEAGDKPSRGEPPATVSKRILTDLLREQMGFDGVIVSDAMCMGGVAGYMNYYDACAAFLEAGGDCLLFVRYDTHFENEMERCLRQGLLREETLLKSASRMLALKERFGLLDESADTKKEALPLKAFESSSEAISQQCIRIMRDRNSILPVTPHSELRVLHLCICSEYSNPDIRTKLDRFTEELRRYAPNVVCWSDPGSEKVFFSLQNKEFDLVIVSLWGQPDYAVNVVRLNGPIARNLMDGWMHLGIPVIFVAHAYPFHHHHYFASMDTVINTYQSTLHSVKVAADGIFGKISIPLANE